jgi:hypothetical protein
MDFSPRVDSSFRPYAAKTADHTTYFNYFYYYLYKFSQQPNYYSNTSLISTSILDKLIGIGAKQIFKYTSDKLDKGELSFGTEANDSEVAFEFEDAVICVLKQPRLSSFSRAYGETYQDCPDDGNYCRVFYSQEETLFKIKSLFDYVKEKNTKSIHLMCKVEGVLDVQRFDIVLPTEDDLDIELNYGEELAGKEAKIIDILEKKKSGLILFSGKPGTGKSTFIKYLSSKVDRKIIYLPSAFTEEITSPSFLSFMTDYKDSIFLLEDAEKVLKSREEQENSAISNILNITDGLLGDCLNIFVIATFNTSRDKIDSALLRKGRLMLEHEFKELPADNCNKIFEKINSDRKTDIPLTLADIYNAEDNYKKEIDKKKIGF